MKITDQNIPPEFAAKYAELVSNNPVPVIGFQIARTRRAATTRKQTKEERRQYNDMRLIAEYIARRLLMKPDTAEFNSFVFAEIQRLLDGIFDPTYWEQCREISSSFYSSTPTNVDAPPNQLIRYKRPKGVPYVDTVPIVRPRVYRYQNPSLRPSSTTYGLGVETIGPSRYTGQSELEVFKDQLWIWKKTYFELTDTTSKEGMSPTLIKSSGTITASAQLRGTRGLLALVFKSFFKAEDSSYGDDLKAPLRPSWSTYWRYRVPQWPFLPWQAEQFRNVVYPASRIFKYEDAPILSHAIIKSGVRPLQGIGYNNNEYLQSSYPETLELWQVKRCITRNQNLEFLLVGYYFVASSLSSPYTPYDHAKLLTELYSCELVNGLIIAKPYNGVTVNTNSASWSGVLSGINPQSKVSAVDPTGAVTVYDMKGKDTDSFSIYDDQFRMQFVPDAKTPQDAEGINNYRFCMSAHDEANQAGVQPVSVKVKYFYWVQRITHANRWACQAVQTVWLCQSPPEHGKCSVNYYSDEIDPRPEAIAEGESIFPSAFAYDRAHAIALGWDDLELLSTSLNETQPEWYMWQGFWDFNVRYKSTIYGDHDATLYQRVVYRCYFQSESYYLQRLAGGNAGIPFEVTESENTTLKECTLITSTNIETLSWYTTFPEI